MLDEGNDPEKNHVKPHEYFVQFCLKNCLRQFVTEATHVKGNILDVLLCNPSTRDLLLSVDVKPPLSTSCDHNLVSFSIRTAYTNTNKANAYPNYRKGDYESINNSLGAMNWENLLETDVSVQSSYNSFVASLQTSINENIPIVQPRKSKEKIPRHLKTLLKEKIKLYRQSKSDSSLKSIYKKKI